MSGASDPGELDAAYEWAAELDAYLAAHYICSCGHPAKKHDHGGNTRHAGDTFHCRIPECDCLDWDPIKIKDDE